MHILFDIGGTKMRLARTRDWKTFDAVLKEDTPADDFDAGMALFLKMARELSGGEKITGIAGGLAGLLDKKKTMLLNSPNIAGWNGKPFKEALERKFGTGVVLENDADVVGLGEAVFGAGRGHTIVAYITVSTGVGGGRIVDGRIDKSTFGFEPGHQVIDRGGALCGGCGARGDLEALVSGSALERRFRKKPYDIPQEDGIWDELAGTIAVGLNNVAVMWSPDVIVLGGSMIYKTPGIRTEAVQVYFDKILKIFPEKPLLKEAGLKDDGGLYGALVLARQNFPDRA